MHLRQVQVTKARTARKILKVRRARKIVKARNK